MKQKILQATETATGNVIATIEFVLAITLIIYGVYVASPVYVSDCSAIFSIVFDNPVYRKVTGILMTLPGWPIVFSQIKNGISNYSNMKYRKKMLLGITIVYLYISALRVATLSIFPVIWIFTLALGFISAILYLRLN